MPQLETGQFAEQSLGESEVLKAERRKKKASQAIKETLTAIRGLSNNMPIVNQVEGHKQDKASHKDPGYYNSKVLGSIFSSARNQLRKIRTESLLSDEQAIQQVLEDEDAVLDIISERNGIRDSAQKNHIPPEELLNVLNASGKKECEKLDIIIDRTLKALETEENRG